MSRFLLYRIFWYFLSPFLSVLLFLRKLDKKEDKISEFHRFARIKLPEPKGKRIWFHAASVGENMISLNIANHLRSLRPELEFLFTCQTQTAAQIIAKQKAEGDFFLFAAFDHPTIAKRFVNNTKPDLAVFIEGEIWPNLLAQLRKSGIKTALINSRMTEKSIVNWSKSADLGRVAFSGLDFAHAANKKTHDFLEKFIEGLSPSINNLKYAAPALEFDKNDLSELKTHLKGRKIWLVASSHEGEEEIILGAHKLVCESFDDCLLVIAPRHLNRANKIEDFSIEHGFKCAFRSKGEIPTQDHNVFIWDVLGQMGLFYSLGDFAFIAGSLLPEIGGHNPIEPAQLNCAIVTGPYYHNFIDVFTDFKINNSAIETDANAAAIAECVLNIINGTTNIVEMKKNALDFVTKSDNLLKEIDRNLLYLIDKV